MEENGIEVSVSDGCREKVCCRLEMVVGDNSGVHDIAGYYRAFRNTQRVCRVCYESTEEIQKWFRSSAFQLRTKEKYEVEADIIESEGHHSEVLKLFGLHRRCPLNKLNSFHCVTGIPLDVTHDIFEDGVAKHAVEQFLTALVDRKVVTLNTINELIDTFNFHRTDGNKPQPCGARRGKVLVKKTCSEMWTLLRLLPLMVSLAIHFDALPSDIKVLWKTITSLISIVQIIMSPSIQSSDVDRLEIMVEEWLKKFHATFPNFALKPKFHYLVHYPNCIRMHGPPARYATIRFEAKHSDMKKFLKFSKNTRNVCKTMANAHQLAMCSREVSSSEDETGLEESNHMERVCLGCYTYSVGDAVRTTTGDFIRVLYFTRDGAGCFASGLRLLDTQFIQHLSAMTFTEGPRTLCHVSDLSPIRPIAQWVYFRSSAALFVEGKPLVVAWPNFVHVLSGVFW